MSFDDALLVVRMSNDVDTEQINQFVLENLEIINQLDLQEQQKQEVKMLSLAYLTVIKPDLLNIPYYYAVCYEHLKEFISNEQTIKQILTSLNDLNGIRYKESPGDENSVENITLSDETSKLLENLNLSAAKIHLATVAIKLYHLKLIIGPTRFYSNTIEVYNQLNENIEDEAKVKELIKSVGGNRAIKLIKKIPKENPDLHK